MSDFDWVIVGGGPHGVAAARALKASGADLRIVEPSGELLHRWAGRARAVAMTWMRSPVGHHVGAHPSALHHFLHRPENADVAQLARPLKRPSHAAFVRHARHIIADHRLDDDVIRGRVSALRREGEGWIVLGEGFEVRARRVMVCTGSNRLRIPKWARALRREGAAIEHVFDPDAAPALDIVGGGISAVQRALEVRRQTGGRVRLWTRRPIGVADFDFDQDWTEARFLRWWSRLEALRRHAFLSRTTGRGSVPIGLWRRLSKAVGQGHIEIRRGSLEAARGPGGQGLLLRGSDRADEAVPSDGLTLATGLEREPMSDWLSAVAARLQLAVHEGLPWLDRDMHWGGGIYVSGPLAALRLGPMAANLVGARWAASMLPGIDMMPR